MNFLNSAIPTDTDVHQEIEQAYTGRQLVPPEIHAFLINRARKPATTPSEKHFIYTQVTSFRPDVSTYPQIAILPWLKVGLFPSSYNRNSL